MKEETVSLTSDEEQRYQKAGFGQQLGFGEKPALLVIDLMNAFTDPEAPFGSNMDAEVQATAEVIHLARQKEIPVIFTAMGYEEGCESEMGIWLKKAPTLALLKAGSRLVEIDERVKPMTGEPVIIKQGPSAFFGTHLSSLLIRLGVDTLIITGCTTSGCVRATAVDALQYSFRAIVPRECVADRAKGPHEANLFDINQKYGDVVPVQRVIDYLNNLPPQE
ncbi:MAG: isochorismatase family protein [Chloroflexi bacterium]|nr:isochorismatase family protein [Chloroflexota bacterium]